METAVLTNSNTETFDPNSIKLPYVMKDITLMAPGIWNDTYYDSDAIVNGFKNTDWNDKENRALFFDHEDRKSRDWIGLVENPKLIGDKVLGDLYIYNKDAAISIGIAKMKCGVSPKVKGNENPKDRKMSEMSFLNFSIVTNPACKKAYINLIQNETIAKEVKKMENTAVISDQPVEVVEELKKKEKLPVEEAAPAKGACMSDTEFSELLTLMNGQELSEYSDFVTAFMKKNPEASIKDAAKAFKGQKEMSAKFASLSEDEIIEQINILTSILRKNKSSFSIEKSTVKPMEETINKMSEQIKELEAKLNAPAKMTVKALSEEAPAKVVVGNATENMWAFLRSNAKIQ